MTQEHGSGQSSVLLKLRYDALGRAFEQLRRERISLISDYRLGVISKHEYENEIQDLNERGKDIHANIREIEVKLEGNR